MRITLGTAEIAPLQLIPEETIHDPLQIDRPLKPADRKCRLVEIKEPLDQEGIILRKSGLEPLPLSPTSAQFA